MLYEDNDYLVHYGIKGQRWGIRRFQNKDGTLTEEGKERYGQSSEKTTSFLDFKETKEQCLKLASDNIRKLEKLPNGPERDKFVNSVLKEMYDFRKERDDAANEAYNEAMLVPRKTENRISPRYAFNTVLNKYDASPKGSQVEKQYEWLDEQILKKSGDWYRDEGVSEGFKNNRSKYHKIWEAYHKREEELGIDKLNQKGGILSTMKANRLKDKDKELKRLVEESEKTNNDLVGVVLKDLNFPDTPENRSVLFPIIFWD